ncbi:hypothetical protein [Clostridium sp. BJN0001]|uniref:hypothetical protein n=1 Tax=Clostridium sp. BJN0001 TaxID=2930219 RepID=UPI001FD1AC3B|nr:hypothetical protein [Clostridium sp. BJN0001]
MLRYREILIFLCRYYEITYNDLINNLKNKEKVDFFLLLLKYNNCFEKDKLTSVLNLKTVRSIVNRVNKAERKLLINSEFRKKFFNLEKSIDRNSIGNL